MKFLKLSLFFAMMKKIRIVLPFAVMCLVVSSCMCSPSSEERRSSLPEEIVTSENTEADFGTIYEEDGLARTVLVVRNNSADTLFPAAAYSHCRCAAATVNHLPVPPGKDVRVEVTYNPAYRSGIFMEEVQVRFEDRRDVMSLVIKGEVIPCVHPVTDDHPYSFGSGLYMSHETLHFGKAQDGENRMIYVRLANDTDRQITVSFDSPRPGILACRQNVTLDAHGRDTLHFRFTMPADLSPGDTLRFALRPAVNGKPVGKDLNVKAISAEY